MKSKIEVRKFAIESATVLLGAGSPIDNVVNKAKEIEGYILDGIMLPDVYDEVDSMFGGAMGLVSSLNSDNKAKK